MKIEKIITKVSRVYYTDSGRYLRLITDHCDARYYIEDFDGDWVEIADKSELEEAEEVFDLKREQ